MTTLYDEYIDRPKLTEQKNPFEYIVPPPSQEGSEQKSKFRTLKDIIMSLILQESCISDGLQDGA